MSGYRFPLQRLLDLRQRAEDQARFKLAESQRESVREEALLSACRAACEHVAGRASAPPGQLEDRALLLSNSLHLSHLRQRSSAQQQRVHECSREVTSRREQLLESSRDRQVIDLLRERRWEQYRNARESLQQRLVDEAGLMTYRARQAAP
jgi:flagellar protein FliJ